MNTNSSDPTPEEIYYAAEQYLPLLSDELQTQSHALLEQARSGKKVDNAIVSLISDDEGARKWMRKALFGGNVAEVMGSYDPMIGNAISVPANSMWVCSNLECSGFEWRVIRNGRPVPPCPKCFSVLKRKS